MSLLQSLGSGELLALLIVTISVVAVAGIPISIVALCQWRGVRDRECATLLTEAMLAQGFSAEEIERVLRAGGGVDERPPLTVRYQGWSHHGKAC